MSTPRTSKKFEIILRRTSNALPSPAETLGSLGLYDVYEYMMAANALTKELSNHLNHGAAVDKLLAQFLLPTTLGQFKETQAVAGMVISGSSVVQLLSGRLYQNADLDCYVHAQWFTFVGHQLEAFGCSALTAHGERTTVDSLVANGEGGEGHSIEEAGYTVPALAQRVFDESEVLYGCEGVLKVFNFDTPTRRRIQLVLVKRSVAEVILSFHSTVVMNVITAHHIFSFYPRETFGHQVSLINHHPLRNHRDAIEKYERRGWRMVHKHTDCNVEGAFSNKWRKAGDRDCLTIRLPAPRGFELAHDNFEDHQWAMLEDENGNSFIGFEWSTRDRNTLDEI